MGSMAESHIPPLPAPLSAEECGTNGYTVIKQYHSQKRRIRVACVGAGASGMSHPPILGVAHLPNCSTGLCLAYKMERQMEPGSWDLTLYEKNVSLGGTWFENT